MPSITYCDSADLSSMIQRIDPSVCNQVVQTAQKAGTPIFTTNDLRTTQHPLAQMIRMLVIRENITKETFEDKHRAMALQTCMTTNNMNYERNNMRRALIQPDITWNFLEKFLTVCGFDIIDVTVLLSNRQTGEVSTLKRSDVQDIIKDNPYHPNITLTRVNQVTE